MTKILLVEDDKSLREIYGVRLLAEGYDIVSAADGEEALAMAIKERPALIITDIMMPKISGFDMLDIIRSTTETKNVKVIVMTALGSDENKDRGDRLGADRYLVKSQVGIEDVVQAVHELLGDQAQPGAAAPQAPLGQNTPPQAIPSQPQTPPSATSSPTNPQPSQQSAPARPQSITPPQRMANPVASRIPQPQQQSPSVNTSFAPQPAPPAQTPPTDQTAQDQPTATPQTAQPSEPPQSSSTTAQPPSAKTQEPASRRTRVIEPLNDPGQRVDIQALLDKELAKEAAAPPMSAADEQKVVDQQIQQFATEPLPTPAEEAPDNTQQEEIHVDESGSIQPQTTEQGNEANSEAPQSPDVQLPPFNPQPEPDAPKTPDVAQQPVPQLEPPVERPSAPAETEEQPVNQPPQQTAPAQPQPQQFAAPQQQTPQAPVQNPTQQPQQPGGIQFDNPPQPPQNQ